MNDVKDFVKDKTISLEEGSVKTDKVIVNASKSSIKYVANGREQEHSVQRMSNSQFNQRQSNQQIGAGRPNHQFVQGAKSVAGVTATAVNYAAKGTYKAGETAVKVSSSAVKSAASTATRMTIQRAPGIFGQTNDLSDTLSKRAGVESVRSLRIGNQLRHSLLNYRHSIGTSYYKKTAINSRGRKAVMFNNKAIKHQNKIDESKSFSIKRSAKMAVNNQVRRQLYSLTSAQNFENKAIGKTAGAAWTAWRYRNMARRLVTKTVSLVSSAIGAVIALVASLPAMIATVISMLPVLVVVIVVAVVLAPFCDLTYKGRIGELVDNIYELNQIYGVEFDPIEMLCITDTLGWSHADYEDYEIVCSLVLDQKKDNEVSFEQMQDNIFSKYNPGKKYSGNQIYNDNENTGWYYYSHSGIDMSIIIGGSDKKNINYKDMMTVYKEYSELKTPAEKDAYGSAENIARLKQICNERYSYNEEVYQEYLSTASNFQAGSSEVGNKIAKIAISQSGKRYWWGKAGPDYYDCSGLVIYAHEKSGVPNSYNGRWTTKILCGVGIQVTRDQLQPGDIILFSSNGKASGVHHVGIYIGNNTMIHASGRGSSTVGQDPNQCVKETSLDNSYYARETYQYRRLY